MITWTYTKPFTSDEHSCLMKVSKFKKDVKRGMFNDDDGCGRLVKNGLLSDRYVYPSMIDDIDPHATHVDWYNK